LKKVLDCLILSNAFSARVINFYYGAMRTEDRQGIVHLEDEIDRSSPLGQMWKDA
jgi:hypothetical protein